MDRNEVVVGVLELFDQVDQLERENDRLRDILSGSDPEDRMTGLLVRYAKDQLLSNCLYSDPPVSRMDVHRKGDGTYRTEDFERYVRENLFLSKVPGWMSLYELFDVLDEQLHEYYEHERKKAIRQYERDHSDQ